MPPAVPPASTAALPPQASPSPEPGQAQPEPEQQQQELEDDDGQHSGWEEPTTVQAPTWDDEPQVKPPGIAVDSWLGAETTEESQHEVTEAQGQEPGPEPIPSSHPSQLQSQPHEPETSHAVGPPAKPRTPVAHRPGASTHRSNARFKTTDQPVVMPVSFATSVEKVGMQFGSLSLGGDVLDLIL